MKVDESQESLNKVGYYKICTVRVQLYSYSKENKFLEFSRVYMPINFFTEILANIVYNYPIHTYRKCNFLS